MIKHNSSMYNFTFFSEDPKTPPVTITLSPIEDTFEDKVGEILTFKIVEIERRVVER